MGAVQLDRGAWLKGAGARCEVRPEVPVRAWRLVLLGAPGVGKGTQAELVCERLGACHLSTGDVFRAAKANCSCELSAGMEAALGYMRRGELVPDETVIAIVRERVGCLKCYAGFVLDGFPRTVAQAEALDGILREHRKPLDAVIDYRMPVDAVVERIGGRRTCAGCKAVFNVTGRPPVRDGVCDKCGGMLVQREDDRPEAVRVRMEAYERSARPLADYYDRAGVLKVVSADGPAKAVYVRAMDALGVPA